MKRCPACQRTFSDEISFCLEDGTALSSSTDAEKTLIAPPPPTIALPRFETPSAPTTPARKFSPLIILLVMVTLGALALAAYQTFKPHPQTSGPDISPAAVPGPTQGATPTQSPSNSKMAARPDETSRADANAAATPSTTPRSTPSPLANAPDWYVIIGTFALDERAGAEERASAARAEGFRVRIVETNDYPNFTPNFLAVVIGPLDKAAADQQGTEVRAKLSITPTIKRGG